MVTGWVVAIRREPIFKADRLLYLGRIKRSQENKLGYIVKHKTLLFFLETA